jgi:hypothetical protein
MLVPLGSVNTTACAMPGVMSLRRSDLTPALASLVESSPRSLPGAT